jgi:hypothetical protein
MSDESAIFTDDNAALSFVAALGLEIVDVGEQHASLISHDDPDKKSQDELLIKANAMMVFSALLTLGIVENKNVEVAKLAAKIWTSPMMAELNKIAFADEINQAGEYINSSITDIEDFINKETNESSSESGDGSSDI